MEARWTIQMARDRLDARAKELTAHDFNDGVWLVTPDMSLTVENACYEHMGPFYLVWTEHHGHFFEHQDDVELFRAWRMIPHVTDDEDT